MTEQNLKHIQDARYFERLKEIVGVLDRAKERHLALQARVNNLNQATVGQVNGINSGIVNGQGAGQVNGGAPTHGGYPTSGGTIGNAQNVPLAPLYSGATISAGTIMSAGTVNWNTPVYAITGGIPTMGSNCEPEPMMKDGFLPEIKMIARDEFGRDVKMVLEPEPNISAQESLKLMLLVHCYTKSTSKFNPLAYVKKHGLERHFNYS